jgi:quercetin dioxygenase-like cupin family protein
MSRAFVAQPGRQQQLEWLNDATLSMLLDGAATEGKLTVGRFDLREGDAAPYHVHTREDEVFLLIKGTALAWCGDDQAELSEGSVIYLPRNIPHAYRITSEKADMLMICTPAGGEVFFRHAGRDRATPRPEGFEITAQRLAEASSMSGSTIVGPPR